MRITFPAAHERIGAVRIFEAGRIIELGSAGDVTAADALADHVFLSAEAIATITSSPICPPHVAAAHPTDAPPPVRYPAFASRPGIDVEHIEKVGTTRADP